MKPLIFALAITILFVGFTIYQQDHNRYIRELENLKYVADECSASGVLYFIETEYSEGRMIFNQPESKKVIEYILKHALHLDDYFYPQDAYWTDRIEYEAYFFDESNISFPYLYTDSETAFTKAIFYPTVVVKINAGRPRYRLSFLPAQDVIRISAYEHKER